MLIILPFLSYARRMDRFNEPSPLSLKERWPPAPAPSVASILTNNTLYFLIVRHWWFGRARVYLQDGESV
jgi:hypothetical protein